MGQPIESVWEAIGLTNHLDGEVWECGVFEGETALLVKRVLDEAKSLRTLRLFDTFAGLPVSGPHDIHKVGAMRASEVLVRDRFKDKDRVVFEVGVMPATFSHLGDARISVANIDVDQYESVLACLSFIYPRTQPGGYLFLDDYNCRACPGAHRAVDEFMVGKPEKLVTSSCISSPKAWVVKV